MKLSLNWLADHVDLDGLDPATIARDLTLKTALIEGVLDQRAALAGVVVGRVLEQRRHPGADRLSLCRVEHGAGRPAEVVCGAPNVAAGQLILYAPVGTTLPNGVKLKAAKIRGELSEGMICAEDELGLGPEHDGILVLGEGARPGQPVAQLPGLADVVFEIDNKSVTHRPDLWGHRGFARELAAIYGRELKPLAQREGLAAGDQGPSIELADSGGCPLYAGLCVEDAPSRSPDWLRFRLIACGLRPRSLIVDLSNYVMLELGQPTHPFDRAQLAGDRVVVRRARDGETLALLDGSQVRAAAEDLVIADGERALALAGIMGGAASEVGDGTTSVFLESASFDGARVRRTSSRLGLRTDALARFEKGLDPSLVVTALRRYAFLLERLRPSAKVAAHFRQAGEAQAPTRRIALSTAKLARRLGVDPGPAAARESLERLGFDVRPDGPEQLDVGVPSWRATRDVTIEEDLIEEVGRLVGYDRVVGATPRAPLRLGARDPLLAVEDALRDGFARQGFSECLSYSFVADDVLRRAAVPRAEALPRLAHPLQQDAARLRPSVVPGLLARLEDWLRHDEAVRVFEAGRGNARAADGSVRERREFVAVVAGRAAADARDLVRELRGLVDAALGGLGVFGARVEPAPASVDEPWWHPRRTAQVRAGADDVVLGLLGALAPQIAANFEVRGSAGIIRLDVGELAALGAAVPRHARLSRFPPVRLDLAFVLPYELPADVVAAEMRRAGPRLLRSVTAFDVWRGKPLGEHERSVAFHLSFQAEDRTLTDGEVAKARDRIVAAVEQLGARLR